MVVSTECTIIRQPNRHGWLQITGALGLVTPKRMLEEMRLALVLLAGTTLGITGRGLESVEEHAAIVAAISRKDSDEAEACARAHIRIAFRARVRLSQA